MLFLVMTLVEAFKHLAFHWHQIENDQRRKYTNQPYVTHTLAVADIYGTFFPNDPIGIAAAHGHDLFEDTLATPLLLEKQAQELMGGAEVANTIDIAHVLLAIRDLTDEFTPEHYPDMPRAERKLAERNRLMFVRERAQNIKVADLMDNTSDIVKHDPGFARIYLDEKIALLANLKKADVRMKAVAHGQIWAARLELDKDKPIGYTRP